MSESIPGVKPIRKKSADGSVRTLYYHRATMLRLPDDTSAPAFALALAQANRQAEAARAKPADVETIASLIRRYQAAPDWTGLAASTREIEQFNVNAIEREFGDWPLSEVERKGARSAFLEWRDDMAEETPRAADAKLTRFARILKFAFDREMIDRHPLATFKRVYKSNRSEIIWLPEHFKALNESAAKPAVKLAAFVALHTGQRRGDLIALRWKQYDGKGIGLVQSKGKRRVYVPCTKALRDALDDLRALAVEAAGGADVGELPILNSSRGVPWTANAFRLAWVHAFEASGIADDLHFHDIRGTSVTMLAEAGCTVPEIATITGHTLASVTSILERYLNRTKALAESAIAKLEIRMAA